LDYNKSALTTKDFFAKVQNKLHYAIHGYTAAELIIKRANSNEQNMGLTSWDNSPDGKILKTDVAIAKNYLNKEELESMGRIVNAFLDLAEERAKRKIPMTMEDWAKRLVLFLEFDERKILILMIMAKYLHNLLKNLLKVSLKNTALFKINFLKAISTKKLRNS